LGNVCAGTIRLVLQVVSFYRSITLNDLNSLFWNLQRMSRARDIAIPRMLCFAAFSYCHRDAVVKVQRAEVIVFGDCAAHGCIFDDGLGCFRWC
jgi:hypothetical protein